MGTSDQIDITFAFDRATVRSKDGDGRLHVAVANISKANVCPYYGSEIPNWEKYGLDPKRRYMLLRDPDELEKAVPSFNNIPILSTHVPATTDDFPHDKVIGSTGTDAAFDAPYLTNSLVFWPRAAIDDIESNVRKQLSCGYRYRLDLTPGMYKGAHFDGVMRDIEGNHVALVAEGRAGADVYVGDSQIRPNSWIPLKRYTNVSRLTDALRQKYGTPRAAIEALGLDSALLDNTTENRMGHLSRSAAERIADELKARGLLAMDSNVSDVIARVMALDNVAGADATTEANAGLPVYLREKYEEEEAEDETEEERKEDEEYDRRAKDARLRLGRDETEEEEEEREEREEREREEEREEREREESEDRRRRRADDARKRLGRDETEEEREEREREEEREEGRDRRRARDRRRLGRDYRRARDVHRRARDAHRRAMDKYRRADDGRRGAMDARNADDAARFSKDLAAADEECRETHDRMIKARDARFRARDARRAHDRRYRTHDRRRANDALPPFKGRSSVRGMMDEAAMDAAINDRVQREVAAAIRENDRRHLAITEAMRSVRPKVGELAMDSSIRSAADVYDRALTVLGVDHAGVRDEAALKLAFQLAAKPGSSDQHYQQRYAQDSAPANSLAEFESFFGPGATKIERFG